MKKEYRTYLGDILESIQRIEEYVENLSESDFYENYQVQDAVLRRLEIMGEAVKNIPDYVRENYPDIQWRKFA